MSSPDELPPWTDLDDNILSLVAGFCTLEDYASCRAVCSSWRRALPPPPSGPLAVLPADDTAGRPLSVAVCFLHTQRWHRLPAAQHRPTKLDTADCRCVGARDGWVAIVGGSDAKTRRRGGAALFNPFTGEEIALDASLYEPAHDPAPKIVFSSNPAPKDFVAASICRPDRLVVQRACGNGRFTAIEDTAGFMDGVVLVDAACGDDGSVYVLAQDGRVYVLRVERRYRCRSMSVVEVRPLLSGDVVDAFPPPYDTISELTDVKNLALCDGVLYQIWRRSAGAGYAAVDLPPGGLQQKIRVRAGDVFVLKHEAASWTVVEGKDLCGGAVFIGMNNATVVHGDGVRPNSVYYWDRLTGEDYEPVVYDMVTRSSTRWPAVTGGLSTPVWYFRPVGQRRHSVEATDLKVTVDDGEATTSMESDDEDNSQLMLHKDIRRGLTMFMPTPIKKTDTIM